MYLVGDRKYNNSKLETTFKQFEDLTEAIEYLDILEYFSIYEKQENGTYKCLKETIKEL